MIGFDVLVVLLGVKSYIVFIIVYDEFVINVFEFNVVDYFLKFYKESCFFEVIFRV